MTYPPPGGENPQYQLQPEPQQPSDPYMQGYNSTPPPGNYYQQPPQYTQPQYSQPQYPQQPGQPMMPPQVGVQPGYPTAPGSVLPPPIPPAKEGGNLGIILAVVVGLVVVLGVAAVLIIPGMVNKDDEDPQAGGGDDVTSEEAAKSEEATEEEPAPTEEEAPVDPGGEDDFATWGTPINSEQYETGTPEAAALNYRLAADTDDDAMMQSQVCASPSGAMQSDLDYELDAEGGNYGFLLWSMSREVTGGMEVWVGWTWDDSEPSNQAEIDEGSGYIFTAVEEGGEWKLCDRTY